MRSRPFLFLAVAIGLLLAAAPARAAGPRITLLDAGAEPREQIVLTPEVGTTQRIEIAGASGASVEISLVPDPEPTSQTSRTVLDLEVTDVAADGAITARVVVSEASTVVDAQREEKRDEAPSLQGRTGTLVLEPNGSVRSFSEDDADGPRLAELARQLVTPFPSEPIGIGARWRVSDVLDLDVVQIRLITVYELVDFDGQTATLTTHLTTQIADAELSLNDDSIKAELTELTTAGSATIEQSVASVAPARRDDSGHYVVAVEGRKGFLPFKLRMDIEATSRMVSSARTVVGP